MKKILVTGASGYLGQHLAFRLNKIEFDVHYTSYKKIQDTLARASKTSTSRHFDYLIHLGGPSAKDLNLYPELFNNYLNFTKNLFNMLIESNLSRIIYASTVQVYGEAPSGLISEDSPVNPFNLYSESRALIEEILTNFSTVQYSIARIANGTGAPMQTDSSAWSLVANDFCMQSVNKKEIVIANNPLIRKDFIDIRDVAESLVLMLDEMSNKRRGIIYNIASGNTYSLRELANYVANLQRLHFKKTISIKEVCSNENDKYNFNYSNKHFQDLGIQLRDFKNQTLLDTILRAREVLG
jgi:nucleoside-diphosphate-sugar epimerase